MKKILTILTTAVIATALVSCDKDDHECEIPKQEVVKLPSKMTSAIGQIPIESNYFYDVRKRLVRIERGSDVIHIIYNSDDLPIRFEGNVHHNFSIKYEDNGKKIILTRQSWQITYWLNDKNQPIKHTLFDHTSEFTYNSDGNISFGKVMKDNDIVVEATYSYSDIPAVWRHVNAPEWLLHFLYSINQYIYITHQTNGYMPTQIVYADETPTVTFNYEVDTDNYVIEINDSDGPTIKYEYILAK